MWGRPSRGYRRLNFLEGKKIRITCRSFVPERLRFKVLPLFGDAGRRMVERLLPHRSLAAFSAKRDRSPRIRVTCPASGWPRNRLTTWESPLDAASTKGLSIW